MTQAVRAALDHDGNPIAGTTKALPGSLLALTVVKTRAMADDPRAELANIAASLRAYLEWQQIDGHRGVSRGSRVP